MTVTATRRDPIVFEYVPLSFASAVLNRSSTKLLLSIAVLSLIAQASQTAVAEDNNKHNKFVDINDLIDLELKQLTTTQLRIEKIERHF